jgi:hypothetical protein
MHLEEILNYAPLVMAIMVCFNAIMVGLYAACGKLISQSQENPGNLYLMSFATGARAVMKLLDVLGYHPVRPEVIKQVSKNKKDIKVLKKKVAQNG